MNQRIANYMFSFDVLYSYSSAMAWMYFIAIAAILVGAYFPVCHIRKEEPPVNKYLSAWKSRFIDSHYKSGIFMDIGTLYGSVRHRFVFLYPILYMVGIACFHR